MKVHLYNPSNDLALAIGCDAYTPPPSVMRLERAGSLLPAWWADAGDCILAPHVKPLETAFLKREWGLNVNLYHEGTDATPAPWGWSRGARTELLRAGVTNLPAPEHLDLLRDIGHRRISRRILASIGFKGTLPAVCYTCEEACTVIGELGHAFVKSPWSGSGRGVFPIANEAVDSARDKIQGIINRQGSVIIEPAYDKVLDFAMLFTVGDSGVAFDGYSVFLSASNGIYGGNIAAPQHILLDILGRLVPISELESLKTRLQSTLWEHFGGKYEGPVGVDMMVHRLGDALAVMPCIEVNLRLTMGFVARAVAARAALGEPHLIAWHKTCDVAPGSGRPLLAPTPYFTLLLSPVKFDKSAQNPGFSIF